MRVPVLAKTWYATNLHDGMQAILQLKKLYGRGASGVVQVVAVV